MKHAALIAVLLFAGLAASAQGTSEDHSHLWTCKLNDTSWKQCMDALYDNPTQVGFTQAEAIKSLYDTLFTTQRLNRCVPLAVVLANLECKQIL